MFRQYYVYIITNKTKSVLYTGITSNLEGRVWQHKTKEIKGFSSRYNVNQLVYYEEYQYVEDAIRREKQLKGWKRQWKEDLIRKLNPLWEDLSLDWYNRDSRTSLEWQTFIKIRNDVLYYCHSEFDSESLLIVVRIFRFDELRSRWHFFTLVISTDPVIRQGSGEISVLGIVRFHKNQQAPRQRRDAWY